MSKGTMIRVYTFYEGYSLPPAARRRGLKRGRKRNLGYPSVSGYIKGYDEGAYIQWSEERKIVSRPVVGYINQEVVRANESGVDRERKGVRGSRTDGGDFRDERRGRGETNRAHRTNGVLGSSEYEVEYDEGRTDEVVVGRTKGDE